MKISSIALACFSIVSLFDQTGAAAFVPAGSLKSRRSLPDVVCSATSRRNVLGSAAIPFLAGFASRDPAQAAATEPLADLPMVRLKLPRGAFGREYVAIKLTIDGKGPFDFMVDSGLSTELITPHLQQSLGIDVSKASNLKGIGAGGDTSGGALIQLKGASLCCGNFADGKNLSLPPLTAIVTDFPQEHIDPSHDPVEGMLGMEMLSLFDVDFDFPKNRFRLWQPMTAAAVASKAGLVEIPAAVLNETGLIGIRLVSPQGSSQPVLAFLDCGSTFSAVNWAAAQFLGLPPKNSPEYQKGPAVMAFGVDGRPQQLPTHKLQMTYTGNAYKTPEGKIEFEAPPKNWKAWDPVQVAIGDIPAFSQALGDGITPYTGPAALIGLDVLAQRRVILETGQGKGRRLFVSPK